MGHFQDPSRARARARARRQNGFCSRNHYKPPWNWIPQNGSFWPTFWPLQRALNMVFGSKSGHSGSSRDAGVQNDPQMTVLRSVFRCFSCKNIGKRSLKPSFRVPNPGFGVVQSSSIVFIGVPHFLELIWPPFLHFWPFLKKRVHPFFGKIGISKSERQAMDIPSVVGDHLFSLKRGWGWVRGMGRLKGCWKGFSQKRGSKKVSKKGSKMTHFTGRGSLNRGPPPSNEIY